MKAGRSGSIMKESIQHTLISCKIEKKGNIRKELTYSCAPVCSHRSTLKSYIIAFHHNT